MAQRAAQALKSAFHDLAAQLIVVSQNDDPSLPSTLERSGAEFISAPLGSTRAEMCDLGMGCATGSIVAVRDDSAIGDARWLETYRALLTRYRDTTPQSAPIESVVMDTVVARRVVLADKAAASSSPMGTDARVAAIEIAAAV